MTRDIFEVTADLVKKFEGFEASPYFCPAWVITIGYGEVIHKHKRYSGVSGDDIIRSGLKFKKMTDNRKQVNHLLKAEYPNLVSEAQAQNMLIEKLKEFWSEFSHALPRGLNDNQCSALLSFVYNVGVNAFLDSTMLKLIKAGNFNSASMEFLRWNKAGGKVLSGLNNRRKIEKELFDRV